MDGQTLVHHLNSLKKIEYLRSRTDVTPEGLPYVGTGERPQTQLIVSGIRPASRPSQELTSEIRELLGGFTALRLGSWVLSLDDTWEVFVDDEAWYRLGGLHRPDRHIAIHRDTNEAAVWELKARPKKIAVEASLSELLDRIVLSSKLSDVSDAVIRLLREMESDLGFGPNVSRAAILQ